MGDIERAVSINEYEVEYTYALYNSTNTTSNSDMLLYDDMLGASDSQRHKWLDAR